MYVSCDSVLPGSNYSQAVRLVNFIFQAYVSEIVHMCNMLIYIIFYLVFDIYVMT